MGTKYSAEEEEEVVMMMIRSAYEFSQKITQGSYHPGDESNGTFGGINFLWLF